MTQVLLLRSVDVAKILGVSQNSLSVWRKHGRGPAFVKIGTRTVRYPVDKMRDWLKSRIANIEGQIASLEDCATIRPTASVMQEDGSVHLEVV